MTVSDVNLALTPALTEIYQRLWDEGIEYYHMARDEDVRAPEAVMLLTRGGLTVGGYAHRDGQSAGMNALKYLKSHFLDAAEDTPDTIAREREIEAILIVTDCDTPDDTLRDPSQETLDTLAAYPGIGDGQMVRVVAVHTSDFRDLKL